MVGCKIFEYFGYTGQEGDRLVGFWYYIGCFASVGNNYTSGKFPAIRKGMVLEEGIKEFWKGLWES
jgi:hypothetical protein